ncbi:hypothetical protein G6L37_04065 [Agrobacterium rubi]|nr:hypothetical protein [Agrobacterium rubi]NTF24526.1 hypothetical protein [Agrobacterium rubi]
MTSTTYVIVLDKELGFCRLFRDDSSDIPPGEILCTVHGLRRGYDAMMRLNRERRPIPLYHLCSKPRASGESSYRVMKTVVDGWTSIEIHMTFAPARERLKELSEARERRKADKIAEARKIMARTGISSRKIPKFTTADQQYVAWLKETGRFDEQAA